MATEEEPSSRAGGATSSASGGSPGSGSSSAPDGSNTSDSSDTSGSTAVPASSAPARGAVRTDAATGASAVAAGTSATSAKSATSRTTGSSTRSNGDASGSRGAKLADRIPKAPENVREFFSRRPTVGPGPAAQAVVTDISDLVKAEVALAKQELTQKATEKGMGAGLFVGAAIAGWLALQGLLITAGFALALVLPAWAAALIVSVVLLLVAGLLAFIGKKKFSTPLGLDTTKTNVQEDVAWAKAHLNGPAKT